VSFFLGVENRKKLGNGKKKAEKEKSSSSHLDVLVGHLVQQEQDVRLLRVHGRVVEPARDGVLDRLASRLRLRVDLRGAAADQRQRGDGDRERALRPGSGVLVLLRAPGPRLERRPGRHEPPHDRREQLEQQQRLQPDGLVREDHLRVRHRDVGEPLHVHVAPRPPGVVVEFGVLFGLADLLVGHALPVEDDDVLVGRLLDRQDSRKRSQNGKSRGHEVAEGDAADALRGAVRECESLGLCLGFRCLLGFFRGPGRALGGGSRRLGRGGGCLCVG
jgi:hypothetical protein